MNSQVDFQAEPGTLLKQKLEDATCQGQGKKWCIVFLQAQLFFQQGFQLLAFPFSPATLTKVWLRSFYSTVSFHLERF